MLENNPMGSRRRRRFYHRIGVVPIRSGEVHEFIEVPTSLLCDDPETVKFIQDDKPHTTVVSVSALLSRLLDIVEKMIALAEAEEREDGDEDKTSDSQDEDQVKAEKKTRTKSKIETKVESENDGDDESEADSQDE